MLKRQLYILNLKAAKRRLIALVSPFALVLLFAFISFLYSLGLKAALVEYFMLFLFYLCFLSVPVSLFYVATSILLRKRLKDESLEIWNPKGSKFPKDYQKLNFGAFGLNIFWGAYYGNLATFLIFFPVVNLLLVLYLMLRGNLVLFKSFAFETENQFKDSLKVWNKYGKIFGFLTIMFLLYVNLLYVQLLNS
ncbi:hypothetical protein CL656_02405 [bacterium]|nr:hypothetical protein [bacterium]|tara:strand:+ start:479 stop:1057 length:579 start_codon:yes stop_codon:yes gene_type:complete